MKDQDSRISEVRLTIDKIRAKQNTLKKSTTNMNTHDSGDKQISQGNPARQRVSHLSKGINIEDRNTVRKAIIKALLLAEISQGEALKTLRINVLGLKQEAFAKLVSVSRKTLSEVENDKGNYTSDIINKLFKPFGLQVGLVPVSRSMLTTLFME